MKELRGNIWDYYTQGYWIVIPTNGSIRKDGMAVMGRGLALQAKERFLELPAILGKALTYGGNHVYPIEIWRLFIFPVKYVWQEPANIKLIQHSLIELVESANCLERELGIIKIALPKIGCGNGKLDWESQIKPILTEYLDNRFLIVDWR